jgi:DNA-binding LacI/PurR family transcriptional regulator
VTAAEGPQYGILVPPVSSQNRESPLTSRGAPTINEVAALAGVSLTTVSHVLNGKGRNSDATRARVIAAAERLGYSANIHARGLAGSPAGLIAIQISGHSTEKFLPASAYYLELLNGASSAALDKGMALIALPGSAERGALARLPVDGAIVVDPQGDETILDVMRDRGAPVVTTGRPLVGDYAVSTVDNDHPTATLEVLEHLASVGYERPAIITSARRVSYAEDVIRTYRRWMAARSCPPIVARLKYLTAGAAESAARRLLTRKSPVPDSFFVTTDNLAIGVAMAARSLGRDIPSSLGLVSLGDTAAMQSPTSPITAVDIGPSRVGKESVHLLLRRLSGEPPPDQALYVPTMLHLRRSTRRSRD